MNIAELIARLEALAEERRYATSVHIRDIGAQHIFALVPDILDALRAMQWQPIEEAPHNTDVLLFSPAAGFSPPEMEVWKAFWGWRNDVANNLTRHGTATHFMPLPAPPEDTP